MNYIFNNITHELLTPLTIISASAEKLRELAQPMIKNQYGQYLLKLADTNYFGEAK